MRVFKIEELKRTADGDLLIAYPKKKPEIFYVTLGDVDGKVTEPVCKTGTNGQESSSLSGPTKPMSK